MNNVRHSIFNVTGICLTSLCLVLGQAGCDRTSHDVAIFDPVDHSYRSDASVDGASLSKAFELARYLINPDQNNSDVMVASNPANVFSATFSPNGLDIKQSMGRSVTNIHWQLRSLERDGGQVEVPAGQRTNSGARIEFARPDLGLTEWFENSSNGLEQGFTFQKSPLSEHEGDLSLILETGASTRPIADADGTGLTLFDLENGSSMRYEGLKAWDANGDALASKMEVDGDNVRIRVSDENAVYPITIDPMFIQSRNLYAADGNNGDFLGYSVAISGNTMAVGSPYSDPNISNQGSVYVYVLNNGSWTFQAKLTASDAAASDSLGFSVGIYGNTIIAGSHLNNSAKGAAYIFTRNGTTWTQQQKLVAAEGIANDYAGFSVGIYRDTVVVGAPRRAVSGALLQGAAYIFQRTGTVWSEQQRIIASDGAAGDNFASSVAIDQNSIICGAPYKAIGANTNQGAAYVFTGGGSTWVQQQKLFDPSGTAGADFGYSVSISGNMSAIGAPFASQGSFVQVGLAYVFSRSGTTWTRSTTLNAPNRTISDRTGAAVAVFGNSVVFTSPNKTIGINDLQGAAYTATFDESTSSWSAIQQLTADEGRSSDQLGNSVAMYGGMVVVGDPFDDPGVSDQGSVYIYQIRGTVWSQQRVTAGDGVSGDNLGNSVTVSGDTAVIGAFQDDIGANVNQGSVYVFVRDASGNWTFQSKLTASDGVANDTFGRSVSFFANILVVGADGVDSGGFTNTGAVYVYQKQGTNWVLGGKLFAPTLATNLYFGTSVATNGNDMVVGAIGASAFRGAAYLYRGLGPTGVLLPVSVSQAGDEIGGAVAISGKTIAVGAPFGTVGTATQQGFVNIYYFTASTITGNFMQIAADGAVGDRLGISVSLTDSWMIAGANLDDVGGTNQGSAYLFLNPGTLTSWTQSQKLTASDGAANDLFGNSVSISGDFALVGATGDTISGNISQGSGYLFERNLTTNNWTEVQHFTGNDGAVGDGFGVSAALSGGTVLFGASGKSVNGNAAQGAAYFYSNDPPPIPPLSRRVATPFDFDGDAKTDLSIFRPAVGQWWYRKSSDAATLATTFGNSMDTIAPVDFTGDSKTDIAFFRPSTGFWFVLRSEDNSFFSFPFGANGDVPVPADYDGDGKADAAVFRPSTVTWYISRSGGGTTITGFGASGDLAVPRDYDGDGKADIAIFRPNGANGAEWWVQRSSNLSVFAVQFGLSTDKAVQGDFTGDGKADIAFWRPTTGFWNVLRSEDFSYFAFPFGSNGDMPSPGDYDGDGKIDAAVFRPSSSTWYANRSGGGTLIQQFGSVGDVPVPNAFVR